MSAALRAAAALAVAAAFSSFPSPFYPDFAASDGLGAWSTALLFSVHGAAAIIAMPAAAAVATRVPSSRVLIAALLLDALGGLAFLLPPTSPTLLVGRAVTGFAFGCVVPVATASVVAAGGRAASAVLALLGGVGCGALVAGGLATAGLAKDAVFATGVAALLLVAAPTRGVVDASCPSQLRTRSRSGGAAPAGAFAANAVLGLFTSTVPALLPTSGGPAKLVAGSIVAIALLAAGLARVVLADVPAAAAIVPSALAGASGLVAGTLTGSYWVAAVGVLAAGTACGLVYERAVRRSAAAGVQSVARTQLAGQIGLVLPVLAVTAVAR